MDSEKKFYVNPMYDIESLGELNDFEVVVVDRVETGYNTPNLIVDSINLELRKNGMPEKTPDEVLEVLLYLTKSNILGTNEFGMDKSKIQNPEFGLPNSGINDNITGLISCSSPVFASKVNIGFTPPEIPFSNPSLPVTNPKIPVDQVPFESSRPVVPFTAPKI
jgi:hypothetical protein